MSVDSHIGRMSGRGLFLALLAIGSISQAGLERSNPVQRSRDRKGVIVRTCFRLPLERPSIWFALLPLPHGRGSDRLPGSNPERDPVTLAYIGPGAGFAFLGSFLTLIAGFFLTLFSLLLWPLRLLWRLVKRRKGNRKALVKKTIFLGLDGLDPKLTERFIAEGKLPNLARLAETGSYRRLRTTYPSLSPVAWSTFATGVSPAKHNIFDFLDRDLKSYLPRLSSARVGKPDRTCGHGIARNRASGPARSGQGCRWCPAT